MRSLKAIIREGESEDLKIAEIKWKTEEKAAAKSGSFIDKALDL